MKVYLSNYRHHWISPYTILEKITRKQIDIMDNDPWVEKWIKRITPISTFIQKVLDIIHPQIQYVKIDRWDTWSMDSTLAPIILPMLKQLRETKHGSPFVDMEDVPEQYRLTEHNEWSDQTTFDFYTESDINEQNTKMDVHERWSWVLDEMIFAFEALTTDWDAKYHHGEIDMVSKPSEWDEDGKPTLFKVEWGPNHTSHFDIDGYMKEKQRIDNGLRLFGKYYTSLWD